MTPQQLAYALRNPHALDAWYIEKDKAIVVSLPNQWEVRITFLQGFAHKGLCWTVYNADGVPQYGHVAKFNPDTLVQSVAKFVTGLRQAPQNKEAMTFYTLTLTETEAEAVGMAIRRTIRDIESQSGDWARQNVDLLETAYAKLDHSATTNTKPSEPQ